MNTMETTDLSKLSLAELAIGEIANMEVTSAIALGGNITTIKKRCQESVYWPEFRRLVATGDVHQDFAGPGVISRCVIGWAKEAA